MIIRKSDLIPKILHQIWVGPNPIPPACLRWMEDWKRLHPDWKYILWQDHNLPVLKPNSQDVYDWASDYASKADVLRYEILYQYGGVYCDVDFECFKPIDKLISRSEFFAVHPTKDWVTNAIFGSVANHPILENTIDNLARRTPPHNGPTFLTKYLREHLDNNGDSGIKVIRDLTMFYPGYVTAWPKNIFGKKITRVSSKKHPYARHHFLKSWMPKEKRGNLEKFYK